MKNNSAQNILKWFAQPSSWLSIIAAIVSVTTFILVYTYKGKIEVILPARVGFCLEEGDLSILLPLTLTNTGSPRTVSHIVRITALLEDIAPLNEMPTEINVYWRTVLKYEAGKDITHDSLKYISRANPFALFGGTSTQNVFELVQFGKGFSKRYIDGFKLTVHVLTNSGTYYSKSEYYQGGHNHLEDNNYSYCTLSSFQ